MDGGTNVGLFGAIGRETKGALRSVGYDLRQSKRFRRVGVLAVATVAGGVIATGALLRGEPMPDLLGLDAQKGDARITDGWFGLGADTVEQAAESASEEPSRTDETDLGPNGAEESAPAPSQTRSAARPDAPGDDPDLVPVDDAEDATPGEEENGTAGPEPTPSDSPDPTEEPATEEPTEPDQSSEAPTSEAPGDDQTVTPSAYWSTGDSSAGAADQTKTGSAAPEPYKTSAR